MAQRHGPADHRLLSRWWRTRRSDVRDISVNAAMLGSRVLVVGWIVYDLLMLSR